MNVQHLQFLVQQAAHSVGSLRGVHINAVAGPTNVQGGMTITVRIFANAVPGDEFPADFDLQAADLAHSDAHVQTMVERSLEIGANEFNALHGKGAYDSGLRWKRR